MTSADRPSPEPVSPPDAADGSSAIWRPRFRYQLTEVGLAAPVVGILVAGLVRVVGGAESTTNGVFAGVAAAAGVVAWYGVRFRATVAREVRFDVEGLTIEGPSATRHLRWDAIARAQHRARPGLVWEFVLRTSPDSAGDGADREDPEGESPSPAASDAAAGNAAAGNAAAGNAAAGNAAAGDPAAGNPASGETPPVTLRGEGFSLRQWEAIAERVKEALRTREIPVETDGFGRVFVGESRLAGRG